MNGSPVSQPTVLLYGEDGGDAYYFWQWLDGADTEPHVFAVPRAPLADALAVLAEALPEGASSSDVTTARSRLRAGAFGSPETELALATALGELFIPALLAEQLRDRADVHGGPVLVRVLPSPSCTRVPWELLYATSIQRRLIELADVAVDPPIGLYGGRDTQPEPWRDGPALYVLDPRGTAQHSLLGGANEAAALKPLEQYAVSGDTRLKASTGRNELSSLLRAEPRPSRFLYFGHVAAAPALTHRGRSAPDAAETSFVLSDSPNVYGVTGVLYGKVNPLRSRPLSALDLVQGTVGASERLPGITASYDFDPTRALTLPVEGSVPGAAIWPMPPRVAIVACESGGDLAHVEPFGLVRACLNAGAELVTATRWTVPTDVVFRDHERFTDGDSQPLVDLVLRVDEAQRQSDPVAVLARWQRERLETWMKSSMPEDSLGLNPASPVLWAAVATTVAPRKDPRPQASEIPDSGE